MGLAVRRSVSTFGRRTTVSVGAFVLVYEWDWVRRNEWGVYLTVERRHRDWLRLSLGPGVIPF